MTITLRSATQSGATTKGSALTHSELDGNFQDFMSSGGSAHVGYIQSGTGAVARTMQAKAREIEVSITDFGATSGADCATALTNALASGAKVVRVPDAAGVDYLLNSKVTIPANITIKGDGKQASGIKKNFNGDMFDLGSYAGMRDLKVLGNTASFTGRGVLITSGVSQWIDNCAITACRGYEVEYVGADIGSNSFIINSELGGQTSHTAVKYPDGPDTGAAPRSIINCHGGGSTLVDFAGSNDAYFSSNFTNNLIFSSTSGAHAFIIGNRIASNGSTMTVSGVEHQIIGNAIASAVTLDSSTVGVIFISGGITALTDNGASNQVLCGKLARFSGGGYGVTLSGQPQDLVIGTGGGSSDTVSLAWGDGTGYHLNMGPRVAGVFSKRFSFGDDGSLAITGTLTLTGLVIDTGGATNLSIKTNAGTEQFRVVHTASATRYITATGSNGGNPTLGTSAGHLLVTSPLSIGTSEFTANDALVIDASQIGAGNGASIKVAGSGNQCWEMWSADTTGNNLFCNFETEAGATVRGSINYNRGGGVVAYNTTSDYRMKDLRGPYSGAAEQLRQFKVYDGRMKGAEFWRPMFVAHEAQAIVPWAVTGEKDGEKYQQMDHQIIVPLLTAAWQENDNKIEELLSWKAKVDVALATNKIII